MWIDPTSVEERLILNRQSSIPDYEIFLIFYDTYVIDEVNLSNFDDFYWYIQADRYDDLKIEDLHDVKQLENFNVAM